MQIELRKVPKEEKTFSLSLGSVKIEGTFCKINERLVFIDSEIDGNLLLTCNRCGKEYSDTLSYPYKFKVSDGVYKPNNEKRNIDEEELVIETSNHIIDFEEIFLSELESYKLEYHHCLQCANNSDTFEKEF